jgi:hypothetical protein
VAGFVARDFSSRTAEKPSVHGNGGLVRGISIARIVARTSKQPTQGVFDFSAKKKALTRRPNSNQFLK